MRRCIALLLIGFLSLVVATSATAQCGPRDTTCWNAVYRADSLRRDSASRAIQAMLDTMGDGYRAKFARQVGCTLVQHGDTMWPPRVGQTLCEVLKRTGVPDRQTSVSLSDGETVYWYYYGDAKTHLVMLRKRRVVAVVW